MFDRMTRLLDDEYEWPEDGTLQRQLLRNADCYLETDGRNTPIRSFRSLDATERGITLPDGLVAVLDKLETARLGHTEPDLERALDDEDLEDLWDQLRERAQQAADRGLLEEFDGFDRLNGWETLVVIANLVADGMEYAKLPIQDDLLTDEPVDHWMTDATRRAPALRQWIERAELFVASSLSALTKDRRSITSLVERALDVRLRGFCRHYSTVVQALFLAVKRATGRFDDEYVVTIIGRPRPNALYGHAWNWYCDANANLILSFDLTGADRLIDTGRALSIFNEGFDGYRWTNTSSFLATLFVWYGRPDGPLQHSPAVERYLDRLVDPTTPYGKALLYNLCHQTILDDHVRNQIVEELDDRGFREDYPAWRIRLAAGTALLAMDSPASAVPAQKDLLDALLAD